MISVQELIDIMNERNLVLETSGNTQQFIDRVTNDSRRVGSDDLFIAICGEQSDGHLFIDKAVKNGAIAIVYEAASEETAKLSSDVASVHVRNSRKAEAVIASKVYNHPADRLTMIGVTGTNGKTSTTYLTRDLLQRARTESGLIGTVESLTSRRRIPAGQTTPGPLELHRILSEMVSDDCQACVMEVSSHAIAQSRTYGISYQTAAFTNLTQDHLDYHSTLEEYFLTKKKLFDGLDQHATAVVNKDDPYGGRITTDTGASILTYGTAKDCDVRFNILNQDFSGLHLEINGRRGQFNLTGEFNASNLACTYGIASSLGIAEDVAFDLLLQSKRVPGRFESIPTQDDRLVVVDYAHTPDALEKILLAVQSLRSAGGNVWTVFGCGGDRDRTKRTLMAKVAESLSDAIVVTSDNPRTENPAEILEDVSRGFSRSARVQKIVDREEAIRYAAANSRPGDIVVIAGKGNETYQVIGHDKIEFDDREKVRKHFPVLQS